MRQPQLTAWDRDKGVLSVSHVGGKRGPEMQRKPGAVEALAANSKPGWHGNRTAEMHFGPLARDEGDGQ